MPLESIPSKQKSRHLSYIVLIVCVVIIVLQRCHAARLPVDRDVAGYAIIGHEMMRGRHLYSDLWERKPPLMYATFSAAECLVGYGPREIFLLNLSAALVVMIGIYFAGTGGGGGRLGGLCAAAFWALICGDMLTEADQPNGELFINACTACAFALILHFPRRRMLGSILLGILLTAATLYKHHTLVICLAILAGHALFNRSEDSTGRRFGFDFQRLRESVIAGCILGATWAGLFLYFFIVGRLDAMIDVLFQENAAYAGNVFHNIADGLRPEWLFPTWMSWAIGPLVLVTVALGLSLHDQYGRKWHTPSHWKMGSLWFIATFLTVALPGLFYAHYYQLWFPVLCVAAGWGASSLLRRTKSLPRFSAIRIVSVACVVTCYAGVAWRQAQTYRLSDQDWIRLEYPPSKYFDDDFIAQEKLGRQLDHLLLPNQTFWNLGWENTLYFASRRSPPSGILYKEPLERGPNVMKYGQQLMDDLNRVRPDLVVISLRDVKLFNKNSPIFPWLYANYVSTRYATFGLPNFQIVVLRDSPLLSRLQHPPATRP